MSWMYESILKKGFFLMDPERAHETAVMGSRVLNALAPLRALMTACNHIEASDGPVELFGLKFPNRVGLAAGFDKNGVCWGSFPAFGFGHVEIGTITHLQQPGNPRPRMFRYPKYNSILNRMGFNNDGAEIAARNLEKSTKSRSHRFPLGINIGKSKVTSIEDAVNDYLGSFALLADYADYVTVNVSSPNTPNLRELQDKDKLEELLSALKQANEERSTKEDKSPKPILLKIAPDLSFAQIDEILEILLRLDFAGIIATNTTMAREGPFEKINEAGGLSGACVTGRATDIIQYISRVTNGKLPIIGVGGIMCGDDAKEKIDVGASLVQIYSGMIYKGPFLAKEIARAIR